MGTSKEDYYACPGKFRVCLQRRLTAWGMDLRAWDAGLGLIAAVDGLAPPPREASDETIRANVACVADWFCGGGLPRSVLQARLERFAASRPSREQSGAAKLEVSDSEDPFIVELLFVTPLKECTQLHLPQARYPSARIEKTWRSFIGNHLGLPSGANDE